MQRLLENLHDHYVDKFRYTVLVPSAHVARWSARLPHFSVIAADQKWYTFAEQWSLYWQLRELKPDLVHFTMPQQPFVYTGPAVTTIHDTTLIRFANLDDSNQFIYLIKQIVYTQLVKTVIKRAKLIITPTEFVRDDLATLVDARYKDKFTVTLEAGEPSDDPVTPLKEYEGRSFFFFVGNAFPYKNVGHVINAFEKFKADHPEALLLLAGKKEFFYEQLEKEVQRRTIPDVHFLGFISDGEKRWALQNAQAFVTASLSEGFCIPLLEAMYENCPVLSSNVSCLPEVAGDAALYFDPHSVDDLVAKMNNVYKNETTRQKLIGLGQQRVTLFSWEKMTNETVAIYQESVS
jgi:glycosyltransferase involved in cell wall biosynthesis